MMGNLMKAMTAKHISTLALAAVIGSSEKTAYNKINGITEFTLPEAIAVKTELFPEYDMFYLFQVDNT